MKLLDFKSVLKMKNPVITLGAFDGVHVGHQEILRRLKQKSEEVNGSAVVISFWPHPRFVLRNDQTLKLLNTLEEKRKLLEGFGVEYLIEIPFTPEFAQLDSKTFMEEYLVKRYRIHHFLLGYNHHFGRDRMGNFELLKEYADLFGFEADQVPPMEVAGERISSTRIRQTLVEGKMELTNRYLGYTFSISGRVVEGKRLGRTIGFPTANLEIPEDYKLVPRDGVYAVIIRYKERELKGMLNIGHRPTVNSDVLAKTIEINIFDFQEDLYGQELTVLFRERIRDEVKFQGIDALKKQLEQDQDQARKLLLS